MTTMSTQHDFTFDRLSHLEPDDEKTLRKLSELLDPSSRFDRTGIRSSIRRGSTAIFVLRHRSEIVASATAVRFTTPTGNHCRIEDVVVDEKYRGKGLGRELMSQTLEALGRDGVTTIELTSRPSRVAANALYQSMGFERRETNVYALQLQPTP